MAVLTSKINNLDMGIKIPCAGYEISAEWYEGKDASKILIVLPGWSSSKARQKIHTKTMVEATGTCALGVDFSGHGESPFEMRETRPAQHFLELVYVYDWAAEKYPNAKISISGSSYGGYLAALLTEYRTVDKLVLKAPAVYPPEKFYELWAVRIDNPDEFDRAVAYRRDLAAVAGHPLFEKAALFDGKTLVVVHEKDTVVPTETTDAYIKAFRADSIIAEGIEHSINPENTAPEVLRQYQEKIANWLNNS